MNQHQGETSTCGDGLVTWLKTKITAVSYEQIWGHEIMDAYQFDKTCEHGLEMRPVTSLTVGKLIKQLFPLVRASSSKMDGLSRTLYRGIAWRQTSSKTTVSALSPANIHSFLPADAMCLPTDKADCPGVVTVAIPTSILESGNHLMKLIELNFGQQSWKLKVRNQYVDMDKLGLSEKFNCHSAELGDIIDIVRKMKVCQGTAVDKYCTIIPAKVTKSFVSVMGNENSGQAHVRSATCQQVLPWNGTSTVNWCRQCWMAFKDIEAANSVDLIDLDAEDDKDMEKIFDSVFPGASPELKVFLKSQHDALKSSCPGQRRWNKDVIKLCLGLYVRSPKAYQDLKDSSMFVLPSGRQLCRYKNAIKQEPGLKEEMLHWMSNVAKQVKLPEAGYSGGLIHDETKIQPDLVTVPNGKTIKLVGFVDTGNEAADLRVLKNKKDQQELAREVLQLVFHGYTGFRFPIAHFPTSGVKASELYLIVWDAVSELDQWGFQVDYIMQDGGAQNREFTKMHFPNNPFDMKYLCVSPVDPTRKVAHVQDFSHNMKKLRNAVLSSGDEEKHTRKLQKGDLFILWEYWIRAVAWDEKVNSRHLHRKITREHLCPNGPEKMRNHLAEDMLDKHMLNLMQAYQKSLKCLEDARQLGATLEFLENTSTMIEIFHDRRPVVDTSDARLQQLKSVLEWFQQWVKDAKSACSKDKSRSSTKMLPSWECVDDVTSMLVTFEEICKMHLQDFPNQGVSPARFNSDIVENHFCSIRGLCNGSNTHPTYDMYCHSVVSVILSQSSKSRGRKGNTGIPSADPYPFHASTALQKKHARV